MRKQLLMILLPIVFVSILLFMIINKIKETKPETNEDFSFAPSPVPEVTFPTKYSTDSVLLEIRDEIAKLKTIQENINNERVFFIPPQLGFGLKLQP